MSQKISHYNHIISLVAADDFRGFINYVESYFTFLEISDFIIWEITNNMADPVFCSQRNIDYNPDIYDLGFNHSPYNEEKIRYEFFDEILDINIGFFFTNKNVTTHVITIHQDVAHKDLDLFKEYHSQISYRLYELVVKTKQTDIYVDYQKKIDFVKKGSVIFSSINIEMLINTARDFFMDTFSAEASGAIFNGTFQGLGFDENDLKNNISIKGKSAWDYLSNVKGTEFVDEFCASEKYSIKNVFIVYDEKYKFIFVLFNIHVDFVPDKEFSELISSILSIALENANNHEKMLVLKLEETEMEKTVDILNKFVPSELRLSEPADIFGVSYPAKKTGGDYFNITRNGNKLHICVADVCGKGYDAAVVTVVMSVVNEFSNMGKIEGSLEKVEQSLNDYVISKNLDGRFVTAFFGIYDIETHNLEYLSLGHEPTILISKGEQLLLKAEYLPVGIMQEAYKTKNIVIESEDTLFIYTDGIIEYIDYDELYQYLADHQSKEPEDFIKDLYAELVLDKEAQKDDFTCVMLKF